MKKIKNIEKDFEKIDYFYKLYYKILGDDAELISDSSLESKGFKNLDFSDLSTISKALEIEIQRLNVLIYKKMKEDEY